MPSHSLFNPPDRKGLEDLWRQRLQDSKLHLDFARNYLAEVRRDFPSGDIPDSDSPFAYQRALRAENLALAEYNRVLRIYRDLTVRGIIPDKAEWLKAQAANASGSSAMPEPARDKCPERQEMVESIKAIAEKITTLLQREVEAVKAQDTDELVRIGHDLDKALDFQTELGERLKSHSREHGCQP